MSFSGKRFAAVLLTVFVSIAGAFIALAGEKDHTPLNAKPASDYPNKQTSENVTIAADVYETGEKIRDAFGKLNPYDHGVLPILVVIENHRAKPIRVDRLTVRYQTQGFGEVEATPAADLRFLNGARQPTANPSPIPGLPGVGRSKKNPFAVWEIEGRAFSARVIPPYETASGFFYFQTGHRSNSKLYLSGIDEAGTNHELIFFEIPMAPVQ